MTRKELEQVISCLKKIHNWQNNSFVKEAICSVERDIARREQQSKDQIAAMRQDDWPSY